MQNFGTKPRIVFFGNERIATGVSTTCPTLTKLIEAGYDIAAVVVNHDKTTSRKKRPLEIADVAAHHDIPVLSPNKPEDITKELKAYGAAAGVLVAYGRIVPQHIIDLFPSGIVNIHPSLLPLHRGSTPIESVLLARSIQTGVSLMKLDRGMDAGAIYAYSEVAITQDDTKQQLADNLLDLGSEMLIATLPRILTGDIIGSPQDDTSATYDTLITKNDGLIDLKKPATLLEREIRAYLGWPGSRTIIAGKDVTITAAHVSDNNLKNVDNKTTFVANKSLCLQTSDGILVIEKLKPAGKPTMTATAFLAGYGKLVS